MIAISRWRVALAALAVVGLLLAAYTAWRSLQTDERLLIRPAQGTAVAQSAAGTVSQSSLGEANAVVVSAGGALIAAAPGTPVGAVRVQLADGSSIGGRVAADPLTGIAIVDVARTARTALDLGDSEALLPGQQLIVAPGGDAPNVQVTYVGRNTVPLEHFGLDQTVLELALPESTSVSQGPVLDRDGKLVGMVVPERQRGAGPGRVFAVPIEQAAHLFALLRLGPSPTPEVGGLGAALLGRSTAPRAPPTPGIPLPIADD